MNKYAALALCEGDIVSWPEAAFSRLVVVGVDEVHGDVFVNVLDGERQLRLRDYNLTFVGDGE